VEKSRPRGIKLFHTVEKFRAGRQIFSTLL
jgi:hypothetical protein